MIVAMRLVPMIGSSALVEWNRYEHWIGAAYELWLAGVGVDLLARVGVLGPITWFRGKWASLRKDGCWIHTVDRTYFAKRGSVAAGIVGKGFLAFYRAFPNPAVRLYRRGRRFNLCACDDLSKRRRRYRCGRRCNRRLCHRHWMSDHCAWRVRRFWWCVSVSGTQNNGDRHGRDRQSAEDPRQQISILAHGRILRLNSLRQPHMREHDQAAAIPIRCAAVIAGTDVM